MISLRHGAAAGLAIIAATTAMADGLIVDNKAACNVPVSDGQLSEIIADNTMILDGTGMFTIEYNCQFDPAIEISWDQTRTQRASGIAKSRDSSMPTVFTILTSEFEPGVIYVYQMGEDEAQTFYLCEE